MQVENKKGIADKKMVPFSGLEPPTHGSQSKKQSGGLFLPRAIAAVSLPAPVKGQRGKRYGRLDRSGVGARIAQALRSKQNALRIAGMENLMGKNKESR